MSRGFVGLLDVLGFSALVSGNDEGEHLQRYLECLRVALDDESVGPKVDYVVFSDSIVLTVENDSESALQVLLLRCSRALGLMLQSEIALRGAVAYGSFFRSSGPNGVFVAGRAILDAYEFERAQDWVGVMLAPSVVKRVPDLAKRCTLMFGGAISTKEGQQLIREQLPWSAFVQSCPSIPFHSDNPLERNDFDGFAVVPTDGVAKPFALRNSIERSMQSLKWLRSLAPTPAAQRKYRQSHDWLQQIHERWRNIVHWEEQIMNGKTGT